MDDNRREQERDDVVNRNLCGSRGPRTNCYFGLFVLFLVLSMMFFGSAASTHDQYMKTVSFIAGCMSMFLTVGFIVCATDKRYDIRNLRRQNAPPREVVEQEENEVNEDEQPPEEPENERDEQNAPPLSEDNEQHNSQQVEDSVNEGLGSRRVVGSLNDLHDSLRTEWSVLSASRVTGSVDELLASRRGNESNDSVATKAMDEFLVSRQTNDTADSAAAGSDDKEPPESTANHEDKNNPSPEAAEGFDESFKFTSIPHKANEFEMKPLEKRQEDEEDKSL